MKMGLALAAAGSWTAILCPINSRASRIIINFHTTKEIWKCPVVIAESVEMPFSLEITLAEREACPWTQHQFLKARYEPGSAK